MTKSLRATARSPRNRKRQAVTRDGQETRMFDAREPRRVDGPANCMSQKEC